ncbi:hypothetical protein [Nitratireductor basaltis]|uniref:Uncharacterized protein n=1 Tax=Nitratireductor basaltis TaxID=472175 RepID=A0A084UBL3_9HYPH|nr:hypothetical protein [Nitratireductor basaltis]KFB10349.1 hypothetical protein EL18_01380 [Nitratireductor basaltis]
MQSPIDLVISLISLVYVLLFGLIITAPFWGIGLVCLWIIGWI